MLHIVVREAWFRGALLYLRGIDASSDSTARGTLWRALKELPMHCVIEGKGLWIPAADKPLGVVTVAFAYPELADACNGGSSACDSMIWEPECGIADRAGAAVPDDIRSDTGCRSGRGVISEGCRIWIERTRPRANPLFRRACAMRA